MSRKITTEIVIGDFCKVHGRKYDYSLVSYKKCNQRVQIICNTHGIFNQTPSDHKKGYGCSKCSNKYKKSTKDFVLLAQRIHGDKYDYSETAYVNTDQKLKIVCVKHGPFWIRPCAHVGKNKQGCKQCAIENRRGDRESFIRQAKKVHGSKYDYSLISYKTSSEKVEIICPKHGIFKQKPNNHLNGANCFQCFANNRVYDRKSFVEQAKKIHKEKYDYSFTKYSKSLEKVEILCKKHGIFKQRPNDHLSGKGCAHCRPQASKSQRDIFEELEKLFPKEKIQIECKVVVKHKQYYYIDICFPEKKIAIEYNGDYWHCNPKLYESSYKNIKLDMCAKEIWEKDQKKLDSLQKLGYRTYVVWERDYKNNQKETMKKLIGWIEDE